MSEDEKTEIRGRRSEIETNSGIGIRPRGMDYAERALHIIMFERS
jgi:hypothetical protein